MVDFAKHVGKKKNKRPLGPAEIYDGLDRADLTVETFRTEFGQDSYAPT